MKNTVNGHGQRKASTPSARLGDIIVALFDEATHLTTDPRRATRLAASALARILAANPDPRAARLLTSES
jgi:hypothetical protein